MANYLKKTAATALMSLLFAALLAAPAYAKELVVGGQAVGVQISTDGVLVAGVSEVETAAGSCAPARDAGVKQGDYIIKAGGVPVTKAADVTETVERLCGAPVTLTLRRGSREVTAEVKPVRTAEEQWVLGLWLRDGISGIGTLTFCDPETGIYGALGHSVSDTESGAVIPLNDGSITDAQIVSVKPGVCGQPGELNGCADFSKVLGSIDRNTEVGIYGQVYVSVDGKRMETGEITPGPATILSTVNGREIREYSVEINRVYKESAGVHAALSVTDGALIAKTGGIVQGMSGSPIIQQGRLVGAVTHVFVSDPTRGYAVSINDMLDAAGLCDKAA